MTKTQLANAFASGKTKGKCHNAHITSDTYYLNGSAIAVIDRENKTVTGNWCGYYTVTTAAHLNAIIKALRQQSALIIPQFNVSRAQARDSSTTTFLIATL